MPNDSQGNFDAFASYEEDCLFKEPFKDIFKVDEWNKELPEFLKKIESSGDQRSTCIMGSLVAEYHTDRLIKAILPKYDALLAENRDFTFAMKIRLLEAFHLLPRYVTNDLHIVRRIRNEFAHSLSLASTDDLPDRIKQQVSQSYDRFYAQYEKPGAPLPSKSKSTWEIVKAVIHNCILACRMFEPNFESLAKIIRAIDFGQIGRAQFAAQLELIKKSSPAKPPTS